jgi:hypothetical protein
MPVGNIDLNSNSFIPLMESIIKIIYFQRLIQNNKCFANILRVYGLILIIEKRPLISRFDQTFVFVLDIESIL